MQLERVDVPGKRRRYFPRPIIEKEFFPRQGIVLIMFLQRFPNFGKNLG